MSTTGSNLTHRVRVLGLRFDPDTNTYSWQEERRTWAAAEADSRSNLFSSVGIGARGVTFTLRKSSRLTLGNAFLWRKQFCFLTSITDGDPGRGPGSGFQVVKAALCETADCVQDADKDPAGCGFPGILTEKYAGHAQLDPQAEVTGDFVLVTPKAAVLAPGSWVTVGGRYYLVRVPHELDPWKNEYEIRRREDC